MKSMITNLIPEYNHPNPDEMFLYICEIVWSNADGKRVCLSGGRDLQAAKKLEKAGLAKVTLLESAYLGPGRSYDTGKHCTTYVVTF